MPVCEVVVLIVNKRARRDIVSGPAAAPRRRTRGRPAARMDAVAQEIAPGLALARGLHQGRQPPAPALGARRRTPRSVSARRSSAASAVGVADGEVAGDSRRRGARRSRGSASDTTGTPAASASESTLAPPSMRDVRTRRRQRASTRRARQRGISPSQLVARVARPPRRARVVEVRLEGGPRVQDAHPRRARAAAARPWPRGTGPSPAAGGASTQPRTRRAAAAAGRGTGSADWTMTRALPRTRSGSSREASGWRTTIAAASSQRLASSWRRCGRRRRGRCR